MELDEQEKEYVRDQMKDLEQFVDRYTLIEIEITDEGGPKGGRDKRAEITIHYADKTFRAEEVTSDVRGSIDLVKEKIKKQLTRHKEKKIDKRVTDYE